MAAYRALALDLDGTLLVGNDLPPANRDALRRARDAGYHVILATARWRQMAERITLEIGLSGPIIACSGAQVYLPDEQRDIFDERLPAPFVQALYELCDSVRCVATLTFDNRTLVKLDNPSGPLHSADGLEQVELLTGADASLPRVAIVQGTEAYARIHAELAPAFAGQVHFLDSIGPRGRAMATITSARADKGAALRVACEHLGIEPSQVVAFGDAENDLPLFAAAGASVAMGQASDAVKAAATIVTAPNDQDGVALAIARLLDEGTLA